ncbi:MAG: sigma-70 family RNA polymerase sigma factor [Labilibaculum sp.]|nr:sigma-70 family RNA polymerase sigma factor [Labilibaculum sp.]
MDKSDMETKDQIVWENICNGNVTSMRILHDRYYFQLCLYANKHLSNLALCEELVSDCFIKLWLQRNHILIQKSIKTYLYVMLRNQLVDHIRKSHKVLIYNTESLPDLPHDELICKQDYYAELYKAIKKIPEQRREILELAAFDSLTYKEIAAKLNISVNTVKTQMGRAYQFLKKELDPKNFLLFYFFGKPKIKI